MGTLLRRSQITGLSENQAAAIVKADGYNELPSQKSQSSFALLLRVLSEPMLLLLLGCGTLYLFMGEPRDAFMLLSFVFVVIGITFYQEKKTEKTLEALKNLSSPRALVVRDGKQLRIPGREVVKGDIVMIREGDRIPADACVLSCENLSVDESLLTGESVPVRKEEWDGKAKQERPGGDDLPFVYSSSLVVSGRGTARVHATGLHTEIGKIGKSVGSIKEEPTLLQKETGAIVRSLTAIGIGLCSLIVLIYALVKGNFIQGLLAGLTLSMAMLPEEFPVVLVIFLTLGAWRISKRKVLTRRPAAIETLGAATVLCTDKTGTLTLNKMKLTSLFTAGSFYEVSDFASTDLPDKFHPLLEYGILASEKDPFDPIETELKKIGNLYLTHTEHLHSNWKLVKEYPLSKKFLAFSHVWQMFGKKEYMIASKGAPEAILDLCHVPIKKRREILRRVTEMSEKGLRILGVAKAVYTKTTLPKNQHDYIFEFVGLLGFIDPPRSTAPDAVQEAYDAGMRVILITGDYPGTAQFVAKKIGIKNPETYITGDTLATMNHLELRERIITTNVFARVMPEQKLAIVNALKANGEIVAMTGDGVNDAPALKSAHIGIAMGERGTDVAREAASLVLLNDDFSSIVAAVRLGRRIFDNLTSAMGYILAVHIPIAGMSLLPLVFNLPVVLFPAHIAFLELIIDPSCSVVFESEKEDEHIMKRPPRDLHQTMFNPKKLLIIALQGLSILLATFVLLIVTTKSGRSELEIRSVTFTSLVLANLLLIIVNLSWRKNIFQILLSANRALVIVIVAAIACLAVILYVPFFADLFHLAPLRILDFFIIAPIMFVSILWFEALKLLKKRNPLYSHPNSE
jgi:Ca2+-transporting ATPase